MFDGSRLKIKRANQHIAELERTISAFVESDFCAIDIEKDANGRNILQFKQTKELPCEVPLAIGDAVHNLRAALDLTACEIVSIAGVTPDQWTMFPVRKTRQELEATINGGQIKIAGADIIDLIVNSIKPYVGGNDALCALHALDVTDKHKLLIPLLSVSALTNVNARIGGITFTNCSFTVSSDRVLNVGSFPDGELKIEGKATPAIGIAFDKGTMEGEPVVPTLHQLSQIVSGVVDAIEKAYLARAKTGP